MFSNIFEKILVCMLSAGALALPASGDNNAVGDGTVSVRSAPNSLEKRGQGGFAWFDPNGGCTYNNQKSSRVGISFQCQNLTASRGIPYDSTQILGWDWGKDGNWPSVNVTLYKDPSCHNVLDTYIRKNSLEHKGRSEFDFCHAGQDQNAQGIQFFRTDSGDKDKRYLPLPTPAPGIVSTRSDSNGLEKRGRASVAWFPKGKNCSKNDAIPISKNDWNCINVLEKKPSEEDDWMLAWDWGKGGFEEAFSVTLFTDADCHGLLTTFDRKDFTDNDASEMDFCNHAIDNQAIVSLIYLKSNEVERDLPSPPQPSPPTLALRAAAPAPENPDANWWTPHQLAEPNYGAPPHAPACARTSTT